MGRRKRPLPLLEGVEIIDIAAEGKAIAKQDDLVVFVPWGAPGDVVDIQVVKKKRNFLEGKITKFHQYSPIRTEPFCEHFSVCGGCKWQHLPYEKQLEFKQEQVTQQLYRIGKLELPKMNPIMGSEKTTFYRNKLEYTFSNFKWLVAGKEAIEGERNMNGLGFHIPGMFDRIIDIEKCWLQPEPSNSIRMAVRDFSLENEYSFYNVKKHEGFLRNLMIRNAVSGDLMVVVVFAHEDEDRRIAILDMLHSKFPEINSLGWIINEKKNDSISDQEVLFYKGQDHMIEEMEDLKFKVGPKSFYQTNAGQAYELYKVAREFADLKGSEVVYDLYTGTGTIANFVAHKAHKVVGIEYIPEAIEDANVNSKLNGIENTVFYAGDMVKVLTDEFIAENGQPDVIITDPPRAGMHKDVVETILRAAPEKVVYVSCNPATQARDLDLMKEKYKVLKVQPVDMFPHTHHVENVVLLAKI